MNENCENCRSPPSGQETGRLELNRWPREIFWTLPTQLSARMRGNVGLKQTLNRNWTRLPPSCQTSSPAHYHFSFARQFSTFGTHGGAGCALPGGDGVTAHGMCLLVRAA